MRIYKSGQTYYRLVFELAEIVYVFCRRMRNRERDEEERRGRRQKKRKEK